MRKLLTLLALLPALLHGQSYTSTADTKAVRSKTGGTNDEVVIWYLSDGSNYTRGGGVSLSYITNHLGGGGGGGGGSNVITNACSGEALYTGGVTHVEFPFAFSNTPYVLLGISSNLSEVARPDLSSRSPTNFGFSVLGTAGYVTDATYVAWIASTGYFNTAGSAGSSDMWASNTASWASNNTVWASNTALWASNTALWASNNGGASPSTIIYPNHWTVWGDEAVALNGSAFTRAQASFLMYGYISYQTTPAIGNTQGWSFVSGVCTGTISILTSKQSDSGIFKLLIDDVGVASNMDLYNGSALYNVVVTTNNIVITNAGYHTLKMATTGKNASSSSYYTYCTKIWFQQTNSL